MMSIPRKVLVLGDDSQSFLATVRSLGRRGVEVHVAPQDFRSVALHSRYIHKIHRLPLYRGDGSAWRDALSEVIRNEGIDLALPCTDTALLPMHAARDHFARLCSLALPNAAAIDVLFDKVRTRELAATLGIATARGMTFGPGDDPEAAIDAIGLPLVLKPRRSFRMENLQARQTVEVLASRDHARAGLTAIGPHEVLLESFFAGLSVGVSVLASEGEVLQFFQHVRVHPARSGSSGYRKSMPLDAALARATELLVNALHYTGVIMFEFRLDPKTGAWILLEGNARPWGSLPLPVALGIDFPAAWMDLVLEGVRPGRKEYAVNRYARNLTRDIYFLLEQLAAQRGHPLKCLSIGTRWLAGLLRVPAGVESSDTLVVDDPRPGIAELRLLGRRLVRKVSGRPRRDPAAFIERKLAEARGPEAKVHVEFVCTGNICRSPYAEKLLARVLKRPLAVTVTTGSSGSLPLEGRTSPADAVEFAALRTGVDLNTHRSRHLTEQLVNSATVLIVFEDINEENVLNLDPHVRSKIFWLGDFLGGARRGLRIEDPYDKGRAAYEQSYALIEEGIGHLVRVLEQRESSGSRLALAL